VILMVAITVILAAVIGTFVLGLGENVQSAPQATLQVQENTASTNQFDLRHRGGDQLDYNEFDLVIEGSSDSDGAYTYDGTDPSYTTSSGDSTISAGITHTIELSSPTAGAGEEQVTVTLVHTPSDNIVLERDVTIDFGT